jgi:hypothetical protein
MKVPFLPKVLKVVNGGIGTPMGVTKTRQLVSNSGAVVPPGSVLLWLNAASATVIIARLVVAISRFVRTVIFVGSYKSDDRRVTPGLRQYSFGIHGTTLCGDKIGRAERKHT